VRIVLDTNVLLSAFAARGLCEAVFQVCLARHEIVLSEHILGEMRRNLPAKLKLSAAHADEIVSLLRQNASIIEPEVVPDSACDDPDDLPVLGTLAGGQADCLVTGDQGLLKLERFRGAPILSPRAFHDHLDQFR